MYISYAISIIIIMFFLFFGRPCVTLTSPVASMNDIPYLCFCVIYVLLPSVVGYCLHSLRDIQLFKNGAGGVV